MTAFHPESVYYGEERCPPGESQVVVLAVPRADGAAGAPQLPVFGVCPVSGWLPLRKVKPWPALRALVSGRASLSFSLCCLALEQHLTVKWRVGGSTSYQLWEVAITCGRTKHGAIRTVLDVNLCFYYFRDAIIKIGLG